MEFVNGNLTMELIDGTEKYYQDVSDLMIEYAGSLLSFKHQEETYYFPTYNILYFKTE